MFFRNSMWPGAWRFLATRADIIDYLAKDPAARLRSGWRHEIAGSKISGLVGGSLALAFDDGDLVLVERS